MFFSNTPVVALFIPIIQRWSSRNGQVLSHLLMPLCFVVSLGGSCTMLGSSSNLLILGLAKQDDPTLSSNIFSVGAVGAPVLLVGVLYMLLFSSLLLPKKKATLDNFNRNLKRYTLTARLSSKSSLVGKSIGTSGMSKLTGLSLFEIERDTQIISAPTDEVVLAANDVLYFSGQVGNFGELFVFDGVEILDEHHVSKLFSGKKGHTILVEAVVGASSPFVGQTVKESQFRDNFGAVVIGVHRSGSKINSKLGEVLIQPADVLLLRTKEAFLAKYKDDPSFALVAPVDDIERVVKDKWKLVVAVILLLGIVATSAAQVVDLLAAALVAVFVMLAFKIVTLEQAMSSANPKIYLILASSFSMGNALSYTGVATQISNTVISIFSRLGAIGTLFGFFFATSVLTTFIPNAAVVGVMYPIGNNSANFKKMFPFTQKNCACFRNHFSKRFWNRHLCKWVEYKCGDLRSYGGGE